MTDPELVPAPVTPPDDPTPLDPTMTAGEAAFAVLRAQHHLMESAEAQVRGGDDPLALKRMALALGRMRAVLAVFGPAIPARAAAQQTGLARLAAVLDPLRDLDVRIAQLERWAESADPSDRAALGAAVAALRERHGRARVRAVAGLRSAASRRTLEALAPFLAAGPTQRSRAARVPVLDLAPALIEREHRGLVAAEKASGAGASDEALRKLRAGCERLRFTVEFLDPLYGKPARRYRIRLLEVEDLLDAHGDAAAAASVLREVGLARKPRLPPAEILALGSLAQESLARARELRALIPDAAGRLTGRRWRRLMEAATTARTGKLDPRIEEALA